MQDTELIAINNKFNQGVEKLERLETCLGTVAGAANLQIESHGVDALRGELGLTFAGMKFYVRVRITDRDVDDVGTEYRVPIGWLDWGRFDNNEVREPPMMSNFYDDRGILCQIEKEEFYCSFNDCTEDRVRRGMLHHLGALVGRTIVLNNAV